MKKITTFLIAALCVITLFSCKKDSEATTSTTASGLLESRLTSGNWTVSYFYENNTDQTAQYTDYKFVFDVSGHLAFANSLMSVNGTWNVSGSSDALLSLNLDSNEGMEQAAKPAGTWQVAAQSDDQVALKRTVDGHPGTEYLNLQKLKR